MVMNPIYEELEQRIKELEGQRSGHLELDLAALFHGFEDSFPVGITADIAETITEMLITGFSD